VGPIGLKSDQCGIEAEMWAVADSTAGHEVQPALLVEARVSYRWDEDSVAFLREILPSLNSSS